MPTKLAAPPLGFSLAAPMARIVASSLRASEMPKRDISVPVSFWDSVAVTQPVAGLRNVYAAPLETTATAYSGAATAMVRTVAADRHGVAEGAEIGAGAVRIGGQPGGLRLHLKRAPAPGRLDEDVRGSTGRAEPPRPRHNRAAVAADVDRIAKKAAAVGPV